MSETVDQLLDRAADMLDADRRVALCLLARARGSTPASAGSMMLVDDAAQTHGTVGGGCVEAEIRRQVITMMSDGRTGLLRFTLDHDYGWDDGLICGGTVEVAVTLPDEAKRLRRIAEAYRRREPTELSVDVKTDEGERRHFVLDLPPRPRLLIAGGGHIGQALCRMAIDLDFEVSVFDDRPDLLERLPAPAGRTGGAIAESIAGAEVDAETYIVIVTRGHRNDEEVLEAIVRRPARYVGMIGSRRKVKLIFDDLRARGVPDDVLLRVDAPIGVDIGSVTVNEIALSIAARLVAVRRDGHRSPVRIDEADSSTLSPSVPAS